MIEAECSCGKSVRVADEHAGKKIRCPQCQGAISVPVPALVGLKVDEDDPAPPPKPAQPEPKKPKPKKTWASPYSPEKFSEFERLHLARLDYLCEMTSCAYSRLGWVLVLLVLLSISSCRQSMGDLGPRQRSTQPMSSEEAADEVLRLRKALRQP